MRILAIETSCDETGLTILEATGGLKSPTFKVLANELASQIEIHKEYGGVFPALAKREHIKNLPILFEKVLTKAKTKEFDLISVTSGPGLEPALWTGIVFAKDKAKESKTPLMPVNHMEGHILSVFGKDKGEFSIPKIEFPALSLLVSGGHTELVLIKDWMKYQVIGETLDDAVGEAFDKVARMMDLPYPGGPEISKLAEELRSKEISNKASQGRNFSAEKFTQSSSRRSVESPRSLFPISLPRPMMYSKNFDFSYSGLKTAVLYLIRDLKKEHSNILPARNATHNVAGGLNDKMKMAIALEFENAAVEVLIHKTKKAIEKYKIKTLIIGGGVSANKHLQREIKKNIKIKTLLPPKKLSTDNSIMIGMVAYMKYLKSKGKVPRASSIKAEGNLRL
jgi:N6-L-threonylcarbamoyladenine synthase